MRPTSEGTPISITIGLLVTLLTALLGGAVWITSFTSTTAAAIADQKSRTTALEIKLDEYGNKLNHIDQTMSRMEGKMDRGP